MSNLRLWDLVEKTDPKYTKDFKGKGGFSGTAVCAQYQRKRATEMLGLYGNTWGVKDEEYNVLMLSEDPHHSILVYKAVLFYTYGDIKGEFPIVSDIAFWQYSVNFKSWSQSADPHKKVRTDALTKGLSELGFNADIFMGEFDDNKYVQHPKQEFKPAPVNYDNINNEANKLKTEQEVKDYFVKLGASFANLTPEQIKDIKAIKATHLTRVTFKGEQQ